MNSASMRHRSMASGHESRGSLAALRAWWRSLPAVLRARTWPAALAALTILGLLVGFHQVVKSAVQQGEILRMGAATRAEAVHQCNMLRAPRVRAACLEQIDDAPVAQAVSRTPPNTAALSVAQR